MEFVIGEEPWFILVSIVQGEIGEGGGSNR